MNENEIHDKHFDFVLRKVLWDEPKSGIIGRLVANGVLPTEAEKIYNKAIKTRVATIRRIYWPQIWIGAVCILVGAGVLVCLWMLTEGFLVWTGRMIILPALPLIIGMWKLGSGLGGFISASSRSGSVADME